MKEGRFFWAEGHPLGKYLLEIEDESYWKLIVIPDNRKLEPERQFQGHEKDVKRDLARIYGYNYIMIED